MTEHVPTSGNHRMLRLVRAIHTAIYLLMVVSILHALYAALTGTYDPLLPLSLTIVTVECVVFAANGMKCPLTALARRYGDVTGHVCDTLFPEWCTRYTFRVFGTLFFLAVIILGLRALR